MTVKERIYATGIVPVVVIEDQKDALPTADALLAGGIDIAEITLRTEAGIHALRTLAAGRSEMVVGAGTVTTLDQCKACVDAGARFIVSPGFHAGIVRWCAENGILAMPGCVTPTEIMAAMELGCDVLKFFPANIFGGLPALKALAGPFGQVRFVPTGGVNNENLAAFLSARPVFAVGGSWLCPAKAISSGDFSGITALCKTAAENAAGAGRAACAY